MIYLVVANHVNHNFPFPLHSYVKSLNEFHSGFVEGYKDINVLYAETFLYDYRYSGWDVSEDCVIKSNLNYLTNR